MLYISLRHRTETDGGSPTVIPANAGIQERETLPIALDARFRGHDDEGQLR